MEPAASNTSTAGPVGVGSLPAFVGQIPSKQLVAVGLFITSAIVHGCALKRVSGSLRTLIGLAGLSLFLAALATSELASHDDTGVQQLLWCLCTSILTDNYDPNTDAFAWKRVMWMLATCVQLGVVFRKTYVASSGTQQVQFQAAVVLKGLKLHFLHGWHCSSWDETKDDSKTQCEHLVAMATWRTVQWGQYLEPVELRASAPVDEGDAAGPFFWRSLLEGRPRRATPTWGRTFGRDCCDIAVKFKKGKLSLAVTAMAFSIKRQYKAKLGSMATLSAQYCYLAVGEFAMAFSIVVFMGLDQFPHKKRRTSAPAIFCLLVWGRELVYHIRSCGLAFDLAEEVHQQTHNTCASKGRDLDQAQSLVTTDLILGSIAEVLVTVSTCVGIGTTLWANLSGNTVMRCFVSAIRWIIAVCLLMSLGFFTSGARKLHGKLRRTNRPELDLGSDRELNCIRHLEKLQDLMQDKPDEMSKVEKTMYPGSSSPGSSVENPLPSPTQIAASNYSLTALEAVIFSQLLGQVALNLTPELNLRDTWRWTSKAVRDGMIDSSWLSPNITRAMRNTAMLEQTQDWKGALAYLLQIFAGEINPATHSPLYARDVSKLPGEAGNLASLVRALEAVRQMINADLDPELELSVKANWAIRRALFAVVACCKTWGGPETVAVPGPLEHEALMTSIILKWDFDVSTVL